MACFAIPPEVERTTGVNEECHNFLNSQLILSLLFLFMLSITSRYTGGAGCDWMSSSSISIVVVVVLIILLLLLVLATSINVNIWHLYGSWTHVDYAIYIQ